jgi:hypothetical protein
VSNARRGQARSHGGGIVGHHHTKVLGMVQVGDGAFEGLEHEGLLATVDDRSHRSTRHDGRAAQIGQRATGRGRVVEHHRELGRLVGRCRWQMGEGSSDGVDHRRAGPDEAHDTTGEVERTDHLT